MDSCPGRTPGKKQSGNVEFLAQRGGRAGTCREPDSGGRATGHGLSCTRLFPFVSLFHPVVEGSRNVDRTIIASDLFSQAIRLLDRSVPNSSVCICPEPFPKVMRN